MTPSRPDPLDPSRPPNPLDVSGPPDPSRPDASRPSGVPGHREPAGGPVPTPTKPDGPTKPEAPSKPGLTRAGAAWFATATALVLLTLLTVFILQNQARVQVRFLGLEGFLPLGVALLVAAIAGGLVVTVIGVVRIVQLRRSARRGRTPRR